jgi:3-oxoisoapionate kinase
MTGTDHAGAQRGNAWPDGLLLAYAGDDFTGSTDAMEAFTAAGVPTVLFLSPPGPHWMRRFAGMRCIGLATTARSQGPAWMEDHLRVAFRQLKAFGAPVLHYKICSTFDSLPATGSIGRAIDIGAELMQADWSPMIVGAPRLKRYQAFGNLFAVADGVGHRLDRHPTMSRHPVTPMTEADLTRHLARQTGRRIELIDLAQLQAGEGSSRRDALAGTDCPVVLIDVIDDATLREAGRLVWEGRGAGVFTASSSGLQYALAAYWQSQGLLPAKPSFPVAVAVDTIAVVSGSCSPVTAGQIIRARSQGFAILRLDIPRLLAPVTSGGEITRAVSAAADAIRDGQSPVIMTAEGPDDPAVTTFDAVASAAGVARAQAAQTVGEALGHVMRRLLDETPALRRIVVAGGDTSGAVASALDIAALSIDAPLAPGAPLCRVWSDRPDRDGLQIVLKGGQMGGPDFFSAVRRGQAHPSATPSGPSPARSPPSASR